MTIQSPLLVGGLAHEFYDFPLGIPSTQLTFTPSFFRGVGKKHQPALTEILRYTKYIYIYILY